MKQILLTLLFIICGGPLLLNARVIYVKAGGMGNGTHWKNALGDLQYALRTAQFGDEIWVAKGTYRPTRYNDRNASFNIPDGVSVYGGFLGYENNIDQRDFTLARTILSGEIGTPSLQDNSFHVVTTFNVSASTVVDGVVITSATADLSSTVPGKHKRGAGWYNSTQNAKASPVIKNCTFTNNLGREGAGLINFSNNGVCEPLIENCKFIKNKAIIDGGGIYNHAKGEEGSCKPTIIDCVFENNTATYGAAIFSKSDKGFINAKISNSAFIRNIAYLKGACIFNDQLNGGASNQTISSDCIFRNNISGVGENIDISEGSPGNKKPVPKSKNPGNKKKYTLNFSS